jgi:Lar family restriction alleviation protein
MNNELKPCPFCGSTKVELRSDGDYKSHPFFVFCDGCGMATQDWTDPGSCAMHWNTRAPLPAPGEGVVTDAMVERACLAYIASARHYFSGDIPDSTYMRAALVAAGVGGGGWVSVGERMPEPHSPVIVDGGCAYYEGNGKWHSLMSRSEIQWEVTHWQPLPPSPLPKAPGDGGKS